MLVCAAIAGVAAFASLGLERRLPEDVRLTPHPEPRPAREAAPIAAQ
jgi:hypothetical protein